MLNLGRLETLSKRFDEIDTTLAHMGDSFDQARFTALVRERAQLEELVAAYREYRGVLNEIDANAALLADRSDAELHALAEEETATLRTARITLEARLTELLLPRDPDDVKDVFIEIRAGAGGDEASLFAADLARMYMRFAETHRMRVEIVSQSDSESGGFKEIVFAVKGGEPY